MKISVKDGGGRRVMKVRSGFTLVELSLSLVFIAILSLTIAFLINDTVATYRRGITLNQINTTGMDLVDDMRAAVQNASTKSLISSCTTIFGIEAVEAGSQKETCENDGASQFVSLTRYGNVQQKWPGGVTLKEVPVYGVFCTGSYSYIWNSGYYFGEQYEVNPRDWAHFKYKEKSSDHDYKSIGKEAQEKFRLLKVLDRERAVCKASLNDSGTKIKYQGSQGYFKSELSNEFRANPNGLTETYVSEDPIDLLTAEDDTKGLALYDLYVSGPAESTAKNAMFYAVSFILGTIQGGPNITASGNFCAMPDDYEIENFDYCAINKFNFAAEATGGRE